MSLHVNMVVTNMHVGHMLHVSMLAAAISVCMLAISSKFENSQHACKVCWLACLQEHVGLSSCAWVSPLIYALFVICKSCDEYFIKLFEQTKLFKPSYVGPSKSFYFQNCTLVICQNLFEYLFCDLKGIF